MKEFQPRVFKFKAWDSQARLLVKLSTIDFRKGELFKKDHILLQFTGLHDKHDEEIYEMDILMRQDAKYLVRWNEQHNGWYILPLPTLATVEPLRKEMANAMKRLCNYFESEQYREQ
ncbi:MAG: YopX family protein [Cyclobacteriaceae bacterium]